MIEDVVWILDASAILDFTQSVPGVIRTTQTSAPAGSAPTGKLIFTGKTFGFLDMSDTKNPYFTVGAFVQ